MEALTIENVRETAYTLFLTNYREDAPTELSGAEVAVYDANGLLHATKLGDAPRVYGAGDGAAAWFRLLRPRSMFRASNSCRSCRPPRRHCACG